MTAPHPASPLTETIREKYGTIAKSIATGTNPGCGCGCTTDVPDSRGTGCCSGPKMSDPITGGLYSPQEMACLPDEAVLASLGCGNPTALTDLHEGETVLDLGSGGGIDVLLSARRVGPTGRVYGLDMTDDMLALARANARKAGADNVEFLKGTIESVPLPDASVDVIISNCVINLSADKRRTLEEAFRVLKPGGRFAVSDVVVRGTLPPAVRSSMALWVGCVAGALSEEAFLTHLNAVGFVDVSIEPTRIYQFEDASALLKDAGLDSEVLAREVSGRVMGAFVRARKPASD